MRNLSLLLLLVLIGACIYGYANNPTACKKLGTDALADLTTIFTPGSGTDASSSSTDKTASGSSPGSTNVATATNSAGAPVAPSTEVAPAATKHFQPGFTASDGGTTSAAPVAPAAPAAPVVYTDNDFTSYGDALAASHTRNRPMLIIFTGSDWSAESQAFDREVLSSAEFRQYINSYFVLMKVDELRNTPVMDDEKKRVTDLEAKFGAGVFPSLLIVGGDEKTIGRQAGYSPGTGPITVMNQLNKILVKP